MGTQVTQEKIICRLCLKIYDNINVVEGDMKDALDVVLPKIDLTEVQKPVVCTNCAELLKKCFDFKAMCLSTHDYIVAFVNKKDAVKLNLVDVYLSKNGNRASVPQGHVICQFCMTTVKHCSAISLDVEGDDVLINMMKQCLPELDLNIIKKPVICLPCHESLQMCFHFVTNCLIAEEKINEYSGSLDINNKNHIELNNLLEFTMRGITANEVDNLVDIVKIEKQFCEEDNADVFKLEQMSCDDSENVKEEVKHKNKSIMDMDNMKFDNEEQVTPRSMADDEDIKKFDEIKIEETFCGENTFKEENPVGVEDQEYLLDQKVELETDEPEFVRFEVVLLQPESNTRPCTSRKRPVLKREKDPLESKLNKNVWYQCECSSFKTKHTGRLKQHLIVHKDPSVVTMHNCESCSYQTKYLSHYKAHSLIHKNLLEVRMYKCDSCSYRTKNKRNLKSHVRVHKDRSELTLYKCEFCKFKTIYKSNHTKHLILHKDPSEITMFQCYSCSYQTKYKHTLEVHCRQH